MRTQDDYEEGVLKRGWPRLGDAFMTLLSVIGAASAAGMTCVPIWLRRRVLARLYPMEAYARRLLVVQALRLALKPLKMRQINGERTVSSMVNKDGTQRFQFNLIESHPSTTPYEQRRPVCFKRPRIRLLDEVSEPEPAAPPTPDRTLRRLRAFEALLSDPEKPAKRLARWFQRRHAGLRRSPLKLGKVRVNRRHELRDDISYSGMIAAEAMERRIWPPPD